MGTATMVFSRVLIVTCSLLVLVLSHSSSCDATKHKNCGFDAIYNFGTSMSDTGNAMHLTPNASEFNAPYGRSIKDAKGRYSDGFLVIDYFAKAACLPLLNPYLNKDVKDTHGGVNFAVAGATALPREALKKFNLQPFINISLDIQLQWWGNYAKSLCNNSKDCKEKLKSSLFSIEAMGANDYLIAMLRGKTIEELKKMDLVSQVIKANEEGVRKIIGYGATQVLVTGYLHVGCAPSLLAMRSNSSDARDQFGCLKDYNDFIKYHNDLLREAISRLRKEHPDVHILIGDYYTAMQSVLDNHQKLGFESVLVACCGTGGKYNFDHRKKCGTQGVQSCSDPRKYISWDGLHMTQESHKHIAKWYIQDIFSKFQS